MPRSIGDDRLSGDGVLARTSTRTLAPRCSRARRSRRPTLPTALRVRSAAVRHCAPDRAVRAQRLGALQVAGLSANHRSGSPTWHGSAGSLLSSGDCQCRHVLSPASWSGGGLADDPDQVAGLSYPKTVATDPVTSGPWPFGDVVGLYLGGAPIHGRVGRGGGATLVRRRQAAARAAAWAAWREPAIAPASAYAERVDVDHRGSLLSRGSCRRAQMCGSRVNGNSLTDKRFSDLRFMWHRRTVFAAATHGLLARPRTSSSTSGPNCSSLRAPMPGIATSAASSVGQQSRRSRSACCR